MNKHLSPHSMKPLLEAKKWFLMYENTPSRRRVVYSRMQEYITLSQGSVFSHARIHYLVAG